MFKRLRERLPKQKSKEELDAHYRKMEEIELEKGDLAAMLIAAFITIVLPLFALLGLIYGVIYLVFIR